MRPRQGFTLSEMLVYIAVLSVFTTALYAVFILTARHFRLSEARSDSMQSSLQAVSCMNRELAGGANTTVQVQTGPAAIKFLSAEPAGGTTFAVDANGELLWQKWVCFYYNSGNKQLIASTQTITPQTTIPAAPTFAAMLASPGRVVGRNILDFSLTQVDTRTVSYTLKTGVIPSISSSLVSQPDTIGVATSGYFTLRN